jgi:hypothetical protein
MRREGMKKHSLGNRNTQKRFAKPLAFGIKRPERRSFRPNLQESQVMIEIPLERMSESRPPSGQHKTKRIYSPFKMSFSFLEGQALLFRMHGHVVLTFGSMLRLGANKSSVSLVQAHAP